MIEVGRIAIKDLSSYDVLTEKIPKEYIDESIIRDLKNVIGLKCKAILIEFPYYESDYLSNYYIFYSKKLKSFSKRNYRLHLFADKETTELIGYIALRPTYEGTRFGRTFLEPEYIVSKTAHMILSEHKVHFQGGDAVLQAVPYMKQEGDVAVCAHVALWEVVRSFTSRFHKYPEVTLGDLVMMIKSDAERNIPSHGLTPPQLADVLSKVGFSPIIRDNNRSSGDSFFDEIISYIESGIPLIAFMSNQEHAVAVFGGCTPDYERLPLDKLAQSKHETFMIEDKQVITRVVMESKFVSELVINDDNYFPYRLLSRIPLKTEVKYTLRALDYAVVPLYPRIQLVYNDVKIAFLALSETGIYNWEGPVFTRIFLTSASTYREYASRNKESLGKELENIIAHLEMPKFIWVIEATSRESLYRHEVNGIVILDSTSATINKSPFLLVTEKRKIRYNDDGQAKACDFSKDFLAAPRFELNLQEVIPHYGKNQI